MLLLSEEEVVDVIDLEAAIAATATLVRQQVAGDVVGLPPQQLNAGRTGLRVTGGALLPSDAMGVRVSVSGGGAAFALLFDPTDGRPLCLMAYPFSTLRTAAVMGLATRILGPSDAQVLTMIGTGRNAVGYVRAAAHVRRLTEVRVYSRSAEHRAAFAGTLRAELPDLDIRTYSAAADAISGAAILCVSTSSDEAVVDRAAMAHVDLVVGMGNPSEFASDLYLGASRIVVTYKPSPPLIATQVGELAGLVARGEIDWDKVAGLGEMSGSGAPQAVNDSGPVVFRDVQGGFGDVALAKAVFDACKTLGRGAEVEL